MTSVRIKLDNYNAAYFPGQTIAGRVECNFDKNFRAVRIKFLGKAQTEWNESEKYYDDLTKEEKTRTVRYYGGEIYFDADYTLVQGGDNYRPGEHAYPFSYILPPQLPSSYEGVYGNVRYFIIATIDFSWKFDCEDMISINLVSPLDLNYLPQLREPVNISVDKTMCSCWCRNSGALTFKMSLPAAGFVPGQEISIGCHVENMTNVSAQGVKFKITELTEFLSNFPTTRPKYQQATVTECREGGIGAHGDKSWTSTIIIPPGYYPNLNPCSIINVRYTLEAEVVVPFPHTNLDCAVPVTIGTIPLSGVTMNFPEGPPPSVSYPVPSAVSPLLPAAPAPYPPSGTSSGDSKYSPAPPAYPPGGGHREKDPSAPPGDALGAPYSHSSAPPGYGGAPYPPGAPPVDAFDLPSYEDTQKLKEKNEKSY